MDRENRRKIESLYSIYSKKSTSYLLILPVYLLYLVFIGGGFGMSLLESMGYIPSIGMTEGNLHSYSAILSDAGFWRSLAYTIYLAVVSTFTATVLGVYLAYCFISSHHVILKRITQKLLQIGLVLPYLYAIFLIMTFFNQSGFLSRVFYHVGLITEPAQFPALVNEPMGIGILLVYIFKGTPFVALFSIHVMARVSKQYEEAALTLGARGMTLFRKVYLPLAGSTVQWCSFVLLGFTIGSFEAPYLLSAIDPVTLQVKLYSLYISPDIQQIPRAMAMSILVLLAGVLTAGIYLSAIRKLIRRGMI